MKTIPLNERHYQQILRLLVQLQAGDVPKSIKKESKDLLNILANYSLFLKIFDEPHPN